MPSIEKMVKKAIADHKGRISKADGETILSFVQIIHKFHEVPILMEHYFSLMGLSKARFMFMIQLFLHGRESVGMSDIGKAYAVSPATLTGIADTLEGEGFIERIRTDKDRRRVLLRLTPVGKDFMRTFLPAHFKNIASIMSGLDNDEQALLISLMERFASGVQALFAENRLNLPVKAAAGGGEVPPAAEQGE